MREYEVNGKKYIVSSELKVGQMVQLANLLKDVKLDFSNYISLLNSVGEKTPAAIAILLMPQNGDFKDKNIEELAIEIENLSVTTCLDMVEDFFLKNKQLGQKFKQVLSALTAQNSKKTP